MITTYARLISVLMPNVSICRLIVMTAMPARSIVAMPHQVASTPMSIVMTAMLARSIAAMLQRDVSTPMSIVMIMTPVRLTVAMI